MAQINFGLLDTSIPEKLGAAPANAFALYQQQRNQAEDRAFQREGQQMQNTLARMQMTKAQREFDRDDAWNNAIAGAQTFEEMAERGRSVDPMRALELQGKVGTLKKADAETRAAVTKQAWEKLQKYREYGLQQVQTPQQYASWLHQQHTDPELSEVMSMLPPLEESLRTIPSDPAKFEQFRQQGMLGMGKWLELNQPKPTDLARLIAERDALPPNDPQRATYDNAIRKSTTHAPATSVHNYGQPVSAVDPTTGQPVLVQFSKDGTPKVAPFAPYNANVAEAARKKETGAKTAIDLIDEAEQWVDKATGSRLGAARDAAGRVVGASSEASQAAARLEALQGALMMAQPRMEGPQSNLDVQLYERMAGRIGDRTVPAEEKRAAMQTIRSLHQKYADGAQASRAAPSSQPAAEFDSMPNPAQYAGKVVTDTQTGIRYRSNGSKWVRE